MGAVSRAGLEATYVESKPGLHARQHGGGVSLEATYEESKLGQGLEAAIVPVGLEATYEESKRGTRGRGSRAKEWFGSYL